MCRGPKNWVSAMHVRRLQAATNVPNPAWGQILEFSVLRGTSHVHFEATVSERYPIWLCSNSISKSSLLQVFALSPLSAFHRTYFEHVYSL